MKSKHKVPATKTDILVTILNRFTTVYHSIACLLQHIIFKLKQMIQFYVTIVQASKLTNFYYFAAPVNVW